MIFRVYLKHGKLAPVGASKSEARGFTGGNNSLGYLVPNNEKDCEKSKQGKMLKPGLACGCVWHDLIVIKLHMIEIVPRVVTVVY